ncbi:MAG: hypothetical protein DWQ05_13565 [Calditrichaeota bacterium]|nr:MAG: hypothetical protein DWQ05_13565 [Calditrichota bacterium]
MSLLRHTTTFLFITLLFLSSSCSPENPMSNNSDKNFTGINDYINSLVYNPDGMLNVQSLDGQGSARKAVTADTTEQNESTSKVTCVKTKYSLQQNFEDIAILRPLAGIVWPGALVKGNESLIDGLPQPVSLPRAPLTVRVDLPGIGAAGVRTIENPTNSSVQAAIDSSLEWWNANAYQEGYVNASSSSYRLSTSYSSQQLALDVGLNVAWATSDVSAQFSHTSTETKSVMMAVYKQAFYSIDMDTPEQPAAVFNPSVSLDDVQSTLDNSAPPAYISSVVYGRIIMFRMETAMKVTSTELEASFRYAAGYSVDGSLEARYKSILQQSTIEVITLGGNAEVASQATSARNAGDLESIIQGENAVYSRNNPGVPISYTVLYLKDHSLAKLGYSTEYTATVCSSVKTADIIDLKIKNFKALKDCDGIEGDGEFEIWVEISAGNKKYHKSNISAGNGDTIALNWEYSFKANLTDGNYFTVKFICKEWDKDILGKTFGDSRMNKKSGSIRHDYRNAGWSNLEKGTRTIVLNSGNNKCSTQMTYTVAVR